MDSIPEAGGELSDRRVVRSGLQIVRRILTAGMDWRGEEQRSSFHLKAHPVKYRIFVEKVFEMTKLHRGAE